MTTLYTARAKIFACRSLAALEGLKHEFSPVPWALEMLGGLRPLRDHIDKAMQGGWSTGAFANGRILYVGGVRPTRWIDGRCAEAEAWTVPCIGWERHLRSTWQHALTLDRLQRAKRIPRIVAFVLDRDAFGSDTTKSLNFLMRLGFTSEARCEAWWQGHVAFQMARIVTNFERRTDLH